MHFLDSTYLYIFPAVSLQLNTNNERDKASEFEVPFSVSLARPCDRDWWSKFNFITLLVSFVL